MSNPPFSTLSEFAQVLANAPGPDGASLAAAQDRNGQLTKPAGALGRLEDLAIWYCGWRGNARAQITAPQIAIFAGNHGVTAQGVSAFPAEVTAQMVGNFEAGGAAINQLAKCFGAQLTVHALDLDMPTQDFTQGPALSEQDMLAALLTGWSAVGDDTDLLVVGEMGIGNTTAAAAIGLALFGGSAEDWAGRGTGVDDAGLARKTEVIGKAVAQNGLNGAGGLEVLRCVGGRELAAMAGAIAHARARRIPVILDGFICTAAAACLAKASPGALDHCVAGHLSAEGAHRQMLDALDLDPLLSLGLRLGEGSGAAVAIGILQSAVHCHSGMATFAEAMVSEEA